MSQITDWAAEAAALPAVQRFPGIAYKSFSYSGDDEALQALRKVPGVPQLFEWIYKHVLDEYYRLWLSSDCMRCGKRHYPTLVRLLERACATLDLPVPDLYTSYSPVFNAFTSGVKQPFIVLHSSLVENFSPAEVSFILGHELGHIKARHVLYSSVAQFIIQFLPMLEVLIPLKVGIIQIPLLIAMYEWLRRAEMSCDRAGQLAVQDSDVAVSALARLGGKLANLPQEFDLDSVVKQYHDAEDSDNAVAKILLLLSGSGRTHPFMVQRIYRLRQFQHGDKYQRILSGQYEKEKSKG
jgi:Zn-dependent protease with chaperone function